MANFALTKERNLLHWYIPPTVNKMDDPLAVLLVGRIRCKLAVVEIISPLSSHSPFPHHPTLLDAAKAGLVCGNCWPKGVTGARAEKLPLVC